MSVDRGESGIEMSEKDVQMQDIEDSGGILELGIGNDTSLQADSNSITDESEEKSIALIQYTVDKLKSSPNSSIVCLDFVIEIQAREPKLSTCFYYCGICRMNLATMYTLITHLKSYKHKFKVAEHILPSVYAKYSSIKDDHSSPKMEEFNSHMIKFCQELGKETPWVATEDSNEKAIAMMHQKVKDIANHRFYNFVQCELNSNEQMSLLVEKEIETGQLQELNLKDENKLNVIKQEHFDANLQFKGFSESNSRELQLESVLKSTPQNILSENNSCLKDITMESLPKNNEDNIKYINVEKSNSAPSSNNQGGRHLICIVEEILKLSSYLGVLGPGLKDLHDRIIIPGVHVKTKLREEDNVDMIKLVRTKLEKTLNKNKDHEDKVNELNNGLFQCKKLLKTIGLSALMKNSSNQGESLLPKFEPVKRQKKIHNNYSERDKHGGKLRNESFDNSKGDNSGFNQDEIGGLPMSFSSSFSKADKLLQNRDFDEQYKHGGMSRNQSFDNIPGFNQDEMGGLPMSFSSSFSKADKSLQNRDFNNPPNHGGKSINESYGNNKGNTPGFKKSEDELPISFSSSFSKVDKSIQNGDREHNRKHGGRLKNQNFDNSKGNGPGFNQNQIDEVPVSFSSSFTKTDRSLQNKDDDDDQCKNHGKLRNESLDDRGGTHGLPMSFSSSYNKTDKSSQNRDKDSQRKHGRRLRNESFVDDDNNNKSNVPGFNKEESNVPGFNKEEMGTLPMSFSSSFSKADKSSQNSNKDDQFKGSSGLNRKDFNDHKPFDNNSGEMNPEMFGLPMGFSSSFSKAGKKGAGKAEQFKANDRPRSKNDKFNRNEMQVPCRASNSLNVSTLKMSGSRYNKHGEKNRDNIRNSDLFADMSECPISFTSSFDKQNKSTNFAEGNRHGNFGRREKNSSKAVRNAPNSDSTRLNLAMDNIPMSFTSSLMKSNNESENIEGNKTRGNFDKGEKLEDRSNLNVLSDGLGDLPMSFTSSFTKSNDELKDTGASNRRDKFVSLKNNSSRKHGDSNALSNSGALNHSIVELRMSFSSSFAKSNELTKELRDSDKQESNSCDERPLSSMSNLGEIDPAMVGLPMCFSSSFSKANPGKKSDRKKKKKKKKKKEKTDDGEQEKNSSTECGEDASNKSKGNPDINGFLMRLSGTINKACEVEPNIGSNTEQGNSGVHEFSSSIEHNQDPHVSNPSSFNISNESSNNGTQSNISQYQYGNEQNNFDTNSYSNFDPQNADFNPQKFLNLINPQNPQSFSSSINNSDFGMNKENSYMDNMKNNLTYDNENASIHQMSMGFSGSSGQADGSVNRPESNLDKEFQVNNSVFQGVDQYSRGISHSSNEPNQLLQYNNQDHQYENLGAPLNNLPSTIDSKHGNIMNPAMVAYPTNIYGTYANSNESKIYSSIASEDINKESFDCSGKKSGTLGGLEGNYVQGGDMDLVKPKNLDNVGIQENSLGNKNYNENSIIQNYNQGQYNSQSINVQNSSIDGGFRGSYYGQDLSHSLDYTQTNKSEGLEQNNFRNSGMDGLNTNALNSRTDNSQHSGNYLGSMIESTSYNYGRAVDDIHHQGQNYPQRDTRNLNYFNYSDRGDSFGQDGISGVGKSFNNLNSRTGNLSQGKNDNLCFGIEESHNKPNNFGKFAKDQSKDVSVNDPSSFVENEGGKSDRVGITELIGNFNNESGGHSFNYYTRKPNSNETSGHYFDENDNRNFNATNNRTFSDIGNSNFNDTISHYSNEFDGHSCIQQDAKRIFEIDVPNSYSNTKKNNFKQGLETVGNSILIRRSSAEYSNTQAINEEGMSVVCDGFMKAVNMPKTTGVQNVGSVGHESSSFGSRGIKRNRWDEGSGEIIQYSVGNSNLNFQRSSSNDSPIVYGAIEDFPRKKQMLSDTSDMSIGSIVRDAVKAGSLDKTQTVTPFPPPPPPIAARDFGRSKFQSVDSDDIF